MVGHRGHQRTHKAKLKARRRTVGVGTAVGAFLAFGMGPLSTAPVAHAEDFGLGELIADLVGGAGEVTGDTGVVSTQAVLDFSGEGFDHALAAVDTANPVAETSLQQWFYDPMHSAIEDWIHSSDPTPFLDGLNQFSVAVGLGPMIADGAEGTAQHVDGFAGGWLFGDGGEGWDGTEAGVAGGDGGAASWFGDGGDGGDGGAGAAGGDGGDGGSLLGAGGDGGNAGDGADTDGLAALGGAGGNAGLLGNHGAVGEFGTLPGGLPSADPDALSTTDGWITDADGRVVLLHGLNQVYKIPPFEPGASGFNDEDAAFLAEHGFNVVRLGVIWAGVEPEPGEFNEAYLDSIAQTVQTLSDHGIRVILDMHQDGYSSVLGGEGAPEWAVQDGGLPNPDLGFPLNEFLNPAENHAWGAFWLNEHAADGVGLENHYARMWEYVAHYFAGNPDVAGYEIMNEPYAIGSQVPQTMFGGSAFGHEVLTPFYNQVDAAIRAVDPNTPVFFEPNAATSLGSPIELGTVNDPNTVLSFHAYCYVQLGPLGCFPNVDDTMDYADAYAQAHNIPAFMSEFGATGDTARIAASMDPANQHLFGWTEWEYSDKGDITTTGGGEGALVLDPSQPPVGDNVDWDKLVTLAEPYPQVVAGTPNAWSFDDGVFKFSYSTEMADGQGSFAVGAQSEISVPKVDFPNGYEVSVTGGHVVSAADASVLVIESDGADTVNVTVSAAGGVAGVG